MKSLFLLSFAFILISCDGADVSEKSRSCTYNDQPVSCDLLESTSTAQTTKTHRGARGKVALEASITADVSQDERYLTFLENKEDSQSKNSEGIEYTCEASSIAGMTLGWKVVGKTLILESEGEETKFQRVSGLGRRLQGRWERVVADEDGQFSTTLEIDERTISVKEVCLFN